MWLQASLVDPRQYSSKDTLVQQRWFTVLQSADSANVEVTVALMDRTSIEHRVILQIFTFAHTAIDSFTGRGSSHVFALAATHHDELFARLRTFEVNVIIIGACHPTERLFLSLNSGETLAKLLNTIMVLKISSIFPIRVEEQFTSLAEFFHVDTFALVCFNLRCQEHFAATFRTRLSNEITCFEVVQGFLIR